MARSVPFAGGYVVLAAVWRDDNSFAIRSLTRLEPVERILIADWDRTNIIGVRDPEHAQTLLTIGRLYTGEENRIGELRVAKAIRDDHITKLEDALMAHQTKGAVKEQVS